MTTSALTWVTPAGSLGVFLENTIINEQFEATPSSGSNTIAYTLLNGNLPPGSTLSSAGLLYGNLDTVYEDVTNVFTIRATEKSGATVVSVRDRTFSIKVTGPTAPYFTNPSGTLFVTNDSVWQSFQLSYVNPDPLTTINVKLINGSLPPGLEINSTGLIRGYANIPTDDSATYSFSLEISSSSGSSLPVEYSITVINQESLPGFVGRNPALLNTQPLSFNISNQPYSAYYLSSNSLGDYLQDNKFIFKFIGYDFDSSTPADSGTLIYEINGLETIGVSNNINTGWQNGTLPVVGMDIKTYNVTARVYKQADPTLSSDTFLLSITVIGAVDTNVTWVSISNLGTINNGSVSEKVVIAKNSDDVVLRYRLTGSDITANLKTIVNSDGNNNAFGQNGAYVLGDGSNWSNQPSLNTTLNRYNFNTSLYDAVNSTIVLGGYDQNNTAVIGALIGESWTPSPVTASQPINSIVFGNSLYVAVGEDGLITTTPDYSFWSDIRNSTVTENLNSVCWDGSQFIAVGDVAVNDTLYPGARILTSPDGITWTKRISGTDRNLNGVFYTGTNIVAVGNLGTVLYSPDGITWNTIDSFTTNNLNSVISNAAINNVTVIVGQNGSIFRSVDNGVTWVEVLNTITTTTLYGLTYDSANQSFLTVGDAGTVIVYSYISEIDSVSSPTLDKLPPNLQLLSTGEIAGRLAFESTDAVVAAGTSMTYTFSIQAYSPTISYINSTKTFTLTTYQEFAEPYDNLYIECYPEPAMRVKIAEMIASVPNDIIYRSDDPYFGKSKSVIYQHMFGVPSVATDTFYEQYLEAITKNFYQRNIILGEIKTAIARDANNNIIYEVVYSEVIDDLINPQGVSIHKQIIWPRAIKVDNSDWWTSTTDIFVSTDENYTSQSSEFSRDLYPNSLPNMRQQIADTIGLVNNAKVLPSWMNTQQLNGGILGYTPAWVICYTKPGMGETARIAINEYLTENNMMLNQIDFQVDRFEVDRSMTYDYQGDSNWEALPSAQPFPTPSNSQDKYVLITQKTILPGYPSV